MRSVAAVLGGFLIFSLSAVLLFQISGRPPETWPGAPFATFAILYGGVFTALAGYVAARLAPRVPIVHAAAVAGLLFCGDRVVSHSGARCLPVVVRADDFRVRSGGDGRRLSATPGRSASPALRLTGLLRASAFPEV